MAAMQDCLLMLHRNMAYDRKAMGIRPPASPLQLPNLAKGNSLTTRLAAIAGALGSFLLTVLIWDLEVSLPLYDHNSAHWFCWLYMAPIVQYYDEAYSTEVTWYSYCVFPR